MELKDALLVILVCVIIFIGALVILIMVDRPVQEKRTVCNYPNINYDDGCCLDLDYNRVCDFYQPKKYEFQEYDYEQKIQKLVDENSQLKQELTEVKNQFYIYQYERDYDRDRDRDDDIDITIIVRDFDTGERIEDAYVKIWDGDSDTEYTDEDGEADFRNLDEDCYDIKVSKSGYLTKRDDFCIDEDDDGDDIRIYLEKD